MTPAERVRALVTAVLAGDDELAHHLAHVDDPDPACTSLEAARWTASFLRDVVGLEGPALVSWWQEANAAREAEGR